MCIETYEDYKNAVEKVTRAPEEDRQLAKQIVNLMAEKKITTCNAKIVLNLCDDILEVNSNIIPLKKA